MAGFKESVKPAEFDGGNYLIDSQARSKLTTRKFSVGCWIKPSVDTVSEHYVIGADSASVNSWHIRILPTSGFLFTVRNSLNSALDLTDNTPNIKANEKAFVVATFDIDAEVMSIYRDGELQDTRSISPTFAPLADQTIGYIVGNRREDSSPTFTGEIWGAFEFLDYTLTPDQIKTLYGQGVGIPAKLLKTYGLDSGLIAGYDLHGENPLVDLSGNDNHLTNVNAVTFDGDEVDVVYQPLQTVVGAEFDGSNSLDTTTKIYDFDGLRELSICAWIRPSDQDTTAAVIVRLDPLGGQTVSIEVYADTRIRWRPRSADSGEDYLCYSPGNPLEFGEWYFIVGTLKPDRCELYINGELSQTLVKEHIGLVTSVGGWDIEIGRQSLNSDVLSTSLFTYALTLEDIKALYNRGVGVDLKKLPSRLKDSAVGLYPLDDLLDYSGNGNDLINVNNVALTATKQGQRLLDKPPTELILSGNMAYMPASISSTIELATADRYTAEGTEWTASCFVDTLSPMKSKTGVLMFRDNPFYWVKIYSTGELLINLPPPVGLITINMLVSEYDGINHLCITSGTEGLKVYWSGSLIYSDPVGAVELPSPTSVTYINWGRSASTTNDRMNGSLASCAFFLSEASAEDIGDLANNVAYESLRTDFKATCKEFITLTEDIPSTGLQHTNLVTGNVVDKAQHSGFTVPTIDYRIKL